MRRRQRALRGVLGLALTAGVVLGVQSSTQADEWYPGLPDNVNLNHFPPRWASTGNWGAVSQQGISYAKRAKQWFRSPQGMVTFVPGVFGPEMGDDGRPTIGAGGVGFMVSPKGAPENYGYLAPMTVRSVGFGLMPVEATVQVSARRKGAYPVPVFSNIIGHDTVERTGPYTSEVTQRDVDPTTVQDGYNVQILKVRVDGVDMGLTGNCRTVQPAPVNLASKAYTIPHPAAPAPPGTPYAAYQEYWYSITDPANYFHPNWGGQLAGSITIPPFTGCTTRTGDDLSDLMTLSVSGPDNPVTVHVGWLCGSNRGDFAPVPPGMNTPKSTRGQFSVDRSTDYCPGPKPLPYPDRAGD